MDFVCYWWEIQDLGSRINSRVYHPHATVILSNLSSLYLSFLLSRGGIWPQTQLRVLNKAMGYDQLMICHEHKAERKKWDIFQVPAFPLLNLTWTVTYFLIYVYDEQQKLPHPLLLKDFY